MWSAATRGVDKVLVIKNVPPALAAEIKAIAATCREAADLLDDFADRDETLEFDDRRLPEIEDETRQDIEGQTQQRLLFSSGEVFSTYLILSQIKAMQYLHHMAATLSEEDEAADRAKALGDYAKRFAAHEKALLAMLKPVAE
jgi:phytoene/squalene synthetase